MFFFLFYFYFKDGAAINSLQMNRMSVPIKSNPVDDSFDALLKKVKDKISAKNPAMKIWQDKLAIAKLFCTVCISYLFLYKQEYKTVLH